MLPTNFKLACKRAGRYTNDNYHTKAIACVARYFVRNSPQESNEFKRGCEIVRMCSAIETIHLAEGGIWANLSNVREDVAYMMECLVLGKFGNEGVEYMKEYF